MGVWILLLDCLRLKSGQLRLPLESLGKQFQRQQRLDINDEDGACEKALRTIEMREPQVASMRLKCELHKASNIRKKTMRLFMGFVRFLIHVSLSMGFGTAMEGMQRELKNIFEESVVYVRGPPPPESVAALKALLDTFASMNSRVVRLRRSIIEALWTGLFQGEKIYHYC